MLPRAAGIELGKLLDLIALIACTLPLIFKLFQDFAILVIVLPLQSLFQVFEELLFLARWVADIEQDLIEVR